MDLIALFVLFSLFAIGIIVGMAIGFILGRRSLWLQIVELIPLVDESENEPQPVQKARRNLEKNDILNAATLEDKKNA